MTIEILIASIFVVHPIELINIVSALKEDKAPDLSDEIRAKMCSLEFFDIEMSGMTKKASTNIV